MTRLIETVGNLSVVVAANPSCCLTIHRQEIVLFTGDGPDRQMQKCSIYDIDRIRKLIEELNFGIKK